MVKIKHPEIPVPAAMASLPLTPNGYKKPWFVKGSDLRVTNRQKYDRCMKGGTCWICGNANKKEQVFITDVRSAMTCRSIEPPSHLDCSLYAIQVCPFLVLPEFSQRPHTMPIEYQKYGSKANGSKAISTSNPGVSVITSVTKFKFGAPLRGVSTQFAYWTDKNVLNQSLWIKGKKVDENTDGPLDKSVLAKLMSNNP